MGLVITHHVFPEATNHHLEQYAVHLKGCSWPQQMKVLCSLFLNIWPIDHSKFTRVHTWRLERCLKLSKLSAADEISHFECNLGRIKTIMRMHS